MTGAEIVHAREAARELRTDAEVLEYLGLDIRLPSTVALFKLAGRYGLDPLLRQVEVLPTKQGPRAYISRDGYLALAHRTGALRGIVTLDASEGEHGWRATVEVRTVDGGVYSDSAGAGFDEPAMKGRSGDDVERMAIARAERRALRRAFTALPAQDEADEIVTVPEQAGHVRGGEESASSGPHNLAAALSPPASGADLPEAGGAPRMTRSTHADQRRARELFNLLPEADRRLFVEVHEITDLGAPWPGSALDELLGDEGTP